MTNELRPLSLGELLDRTFVLYRSYFLVFVGIVALPNLLSLAFQLLSLALGGESPTLAILLPLVGLLFVVFPTMAIAQSATIIAVSQIHLDRPVSIREAFSKIRGRVIELCFITIAVGIAIGFGFLLLIIPGVILGLRWSLVVQAATLEEVGLREAMSRSAELTKGHYGRVFMIYFLYLVLAIVCSMVPQIVLVVTGFVAGQASGPATAPMWMQIASEVATFLTQCLVGPLLTIALSLFYYDERVRKEAFDLEHMMSELNRGGAGSPATA